VGEAKPGNPLTPLLGPHNVEVPRFIEQFNTKTSNITPGIEVIADIKKITRTRFEVIIRPTPLSRLLYSLADDAGEVTVEQLYDLFLLRRMFFKHIYRSEQDDFEVRQDTYTMIGTMKSLHSIKVNTKFYESYDISSTS